MRGSVEMVGLPELNKLLTSLGREAPHALARALYEVVQEIFAASQLLVPVDTGALKSSGHVEPPSIDGMRVTVLMGYGGAAAPYALTIHEDLNMYHTPPTQAKYVETPVMVYASNFATKLGERIRVAMKGR